MPRAILVVVLLAALSASQGLTASTVIAPTFERLVADATEIFVGQVTERASRWTMREGRRLIVTDVTFRTSTVVKGSPGGLTTLTFLGGFVGETSMEVAGMPQFMVGDRDVLFVRDRRATLSPIVAMFHGRFRVVTGRSGGGEFVANNARQPLLRVASYAAPERLRASETALELSAFLATVRSLVRGQ
jgi:hypothetical protein